MGEMCLVQYGLEAPDMQSYVRDSVEMSAHSHVSTPSFQASPPHEGTDATVTSAVTLAS